jgi:hypothetical protein
MFLFVIGVVVCVIGCHIEEKRINAGQSDLLARPFLFSATTA